MNRDAIRRFLTFLTSTAKVERGQLYQLIGSAEASYYLRDVQSQHEIGLMLQSFGYPFNQIGKYYESIYFYRTGQYQHARELLESVANSAPARYRSKAMLSLSAVEEILGRFEESLRLRLQGLACADDAVTLVEAQRGIAIVKSFEGDHRAALRDLERALPLAQVVGKRGHPAYISFLNSYVLELLERNRTAEAEQVANVIIASPFISRYPEWQETVSEVVARRRHPYTISIALPKPEPITISDSRVQAAIDFMKENLHRRITLKELTRVVGVSQTHISYLFRNQVGAAPIEYFMRLRMETAGELLATQSIKEVMAAVGYRQDNRSGFQHQFKRFYELTPALYKKRAQRKP